jgi:hypothetical protein
MSHEKLREKMEEEERKKLIEQARKRFNGSDPDDRFFYMLGKLDTIHREIGNIRGVTIRNNTQIYTLKWALGGLSALVLFVLGLVVRSL